ncbi:hypothetical protein ABG067_008716, partial [Albugo candida]
YGLLAMLNNMAYNYCYADLELFRTLKVYFVHAAGDKIRIWSLSLATAKVYILNRQRSSKVPTLAEDSEESITSTVNMMWELKVDIIDID